MKETINNQRVRLEKDIKSYLYEQSLKTFTKYLSVQKTIAFSKLIQDQQDKEDILIITGELRMIQKLLDVLELREETVTE